MIRLWRSFPAQFAQAAGLPDVGRVLDIENSLPVPLSVGSRQGLTVIPQHPFCRIASELNDVFPQLSEVVEGIGAVHFAQV